MKRRIFLKGTVASSVITVALGAGLLSPRRVIAAWPKDAFQAKTAQDALKHLFGNSLTDADTRITIKAPDIAENGAVVPITVSTDLPGAEEISIIAEKNGTPLAASFKLGPDTDGFVSTRIKMGATSPVIAAVRFADGKVLSARKEVKVTIGGCGG